MSGGKTNPFKEKKEKNTKSGGRTEASRTLLIVSPLAALTDWLAHAN